MIGKSLIHSNSWHIPISFVVSLLAATCVLIGFAAYYAYSSEKLSGSAPLPSGVKIKP